MNCCYQLEATPSPSQISYCEEKLVQNKIKQFCDRNGYDILEPSCPAAGHIKKESGSEKQCHWQTGRGKGDESAERRI